MKKIFSLFCFCAVALFACTKDHGEAPDTQPPVIHLTTPTNNQVIALNQNFAVTATVSDNKKLGEIHLEIVNSTTSAFITHEHFVPDGPSYNLSRSFSLAAGTYQVKVEADDDAGNNSEAQVSITVR